MQDGDELTLDDGTTELLCVWDGRDFGVVLGCLFRGLDAGTDVGCDVRSVLGLGLVVRRVTSITVAEALLVFVAPLQASPDQYHTFEAANGEQKWNK